MKEHVIWNELGILHFSSGDFSQAIQAYQHALELNGQFAAAKHNLARAYTENGEFRRAEEIYLDNLEMEPAPLEKAELWTQLGNVYAQAGRQEKSRDAYQKAAALVEKHAQTRLKIGLASDKEEATQPSAATYAQINLEQITANPRQPRMRIDVQDLVESVREYGVIQPIIVTPNGDEDHYILVSGERRLEAARQVGLDAIPALIRKVSERERLELALVENVQRLNLSSLEQADAYAQLLDQFELSPEEIARRMGLSSVAVRNLLNQLSLPEKIKRALDAGRISDGHARALLTLDDPAKQVDALEQVLQRDLSIRQTDALVRLLNVDLKHEMASSVSESVQNALVESGEGSEEESLSEPEEELPATAPIFESEAVDDNEEEAPPIEAETLAITLFKPANDLPERDDVAEMDTVEMEPSSLPQTADFENESLSEAEVRNRILTFERVTTQNPQNEKAWSRLGGLYAFLGENEKAISAYSRAIALAPENGDYHYRLGQVYVVEGRYMEAVDSFEGALAMGEENTFTHCAIASSYRRMDMEEDAQRHIDFVAPKMEYETAYNRACFESIRGNLLRAIELLETALRLGEATLEKIQHDPDFDFIRDEKLFAEFLQERLVPDDVSV